MNDQPGPDAHHVREGIASPTETTLEGFLAAVEAVPPGSTRMARGARPGLSALLTGGSVRERRKAAERAAEAVGATLIRVDLNALIGKYIGETEKNIDAMFARAVASNFVLFFDEADALFGKRTDVKDAHDRYANIEVSYLLQRIEEHPGIAILSSNLTSNIEGAFSRRLRYLVELP